METKKDTSVRKCMGNVASILGMSNEECSIPYTESDMMTMFANLISKVDMSTVGNEVRLTSLEDRVARIEQKIDLIITDLAANL